MCCRVECNLRLNLAVEISVRRIYKSRTFVVSLLPEIYRVLLTYRLHRWPFCALLALAYPWQCARKDLRQARAPITIQSCDYLQSTPNFGLHFNHTHTNLTTCAQLLSWTPTDVRAHILRAKSPELDWQCGLPLAIVAKTRTPILHLQQLPWPRQLIRELIMALLPTIS